VSELREFHETPWAVQMPANDKRATAWQWPFCKLFSLITLTAEAVQD